MLIQKAQQLVQPVNPNIMHEALGVGIYYYIILLELFIWTEIKKELFDIQSTIAVPVLYY